MLIIGFSRSRARQTRTILLQSLSYIRIELLMNPPTRPNSEGLRPAQIRKLITQYIGVKDGYLGDFSYQKHSDFYADLDLDIDPSKYPGTTRSRFEQILTANPPDVQGRIVQGILDRHPIGSDSRRTSELHAEIRSWIVPLQSGGAVQAVTPSMTSEVVRRALADAEHLITTSGATSAVDRVHTALHGYLLNVCSQAQIDVPPRRKYGSVAEAHPPASSPTDLSGHSRRRHQQNPQLVCCCTRCSQPDSQPSQCGPPKYRPLG